jgi:hypothetical protein
MPKENNEFVPQEVAQSTGTTLNEADVSSSNPSPPSCVDMSKKKEFNHIINT